MTTVLTFLGVLVLLITVHELGHFLTAKFFGVRVLEFGLGFPPRLLQFRRGETLYTLNAIPLGGFVKMLGEEDPTHPGSLARQPRPVRALVMSAGALMNLLLAIVLFSVVAALPQRALAADLLVVGVVPGSPAAASGLHPGDVVRRINGRRVENSADLNVEVQKRLGATATFAVERDGVPTRLDVVPRWKVPEASAIPVVIAGVASGSPAAAAGLAPGDQVLEINGEAVQGIQTLRDQLQLVPEGGVARLLVQRGAAPLEIDVRPQREPPPGRGPLGVVIGSVELPTGVIYTLVNPRITSRSAPAWKAVPEGARQAADTLVLMKNGITKWFVADADPRKDLAGPIGIAQITGEFARLGIAPLLTLAAALSLNLAILNILPLPALDGGRLLFLAIEVVRGGKRIPPRKEALVHAAGFIVLMIGAIVVSYFDIARIARGESVFGG